MAEYSGLSTEEAENSKKTARNIFTKQEKKTFWQTYWSKFDDPIILILLFALGINVIFTFFGKVDWHECAGIFLSILISTFVSALSEHNNENTFQKLQEEASKISCKVYRDGNLTELPITELVMGDKALLQCGDMIPADGQIVSGHITVDQSPLNGESKEVIKKAGEVLKPKSQHQYILTVDKLLRNIKFFICISLRYLF